MYHHTRLGIKLSPDEPTAGEIAEALGSEQAEVTDGPGGAGSNPGPETAPDSAPGKDATETRPEDDETLDAAGAMEAAFNRASTEHGTTEPKAGDEPKGAKKDAPADPIADDLLDDTARRIALAGTSGAAEDGEVKPGHIAASAEQRQQARDEKGRFAPAEEPKAEKKDEPTEDDKALDELAQRGDDDIKLLVTRIKKADAKAAAAEKKLADKEAAEKAAADAKTKAEAEAAERQKAFDEEIKPILRAIDAIPGLDETRYGNFTKGTLSEAQFQQRVALDTLAGKLTTQFAADGRLDPKTKKPYTPTQIYQAAHKLLSPKKAAAPASTTREELLADARRQNAGRSAAALSTGTTRERKTPTFTENDTGPQAMEKAFEAATAGL